MGDLVWKLDPVDIDIDPNLKIPIANLDMGTGTNILEEQANEMVRAMEIVSDMHMNIADFDCQTPDFDFSGLSDIVAGAETIIETLGENAGDALENLTF